MPRRRIKGTQGGQRGQTVSHGSDKYILTEAMESLVCPVVRKPSYSIQENTAHHTEKGQIMFETSAHPAIRNGLEQAHAERGAALAQAWAWLFGGKSSR